MALTTLTQHLAENLRRIRREREVSQKQVARLARVTQAYVSLVEHGWRPARLDHVEALARALAVPTEALLAPPPAARPAVVDTAMGRKGKGAKLRSAHER